MSRHVLQQVACVCACTIALGAGLAAHRTQSAPNNAAQQNAVSRTGFVAGTVVDATTGKGVAGVTVQLARVSGARAGGGAPQAPVITDSQGRFFFSRLMAASYSFSALKPGWSAVSPLATQRRVGVADGERVTDIKIALVKLAVISGTVRDDAGDPVVGMRVMAFRRTLATGQTTFSPSSSSATDDRGVYRIAGLRPGAYFVCACERSPVPFDGTVLATLASEPAKLIAIAARAAKVGADVVSLDDTLRTYAPTLYPSSNTIARAERIAVSSGEDRAGVDITAAAVRAARISGAVFGANGPINAGAITLVTAGESDEGAVLTRIQPMLVQPDGRFDFANVPPGQYMLNVMWTSGMIGGPSGDAMAFIGGRTGGGPPDARPASNARLSASLAVSVSDHDMTGVSVALRPAPSISGRIKMANDEPLPPPAELQKMLIVTTLLNSPFGGSTVVSTALNADGTFRAAAFGPGRYRLSVTDGPNAPSLRSLEVGGIDMTDAPVEITGDLSDVVFTLSTVPSASLRATVSGSSLADGLTALLFPEDRKQWSEADSAARRFRSAVVSRKGDVTFAAVPAGEYLLAVVPDLQAVDWQDPDKIAVFSRTAQRLTIAEGERKTVEVKR